MSTPEEIRTARMPRQKRLRLMTVAVLAAGLVVALTGCGFDDWKEEYRTVDLLADRGFSAADFTDAYAIGSSPTFDYVNFEEIADSADYGGTAELPANPGPVYRLELINLMPNGDFEETAPWPPAGWTVDAGATFLADSTPGAAITGTSAQFSVIGSEASYFDLRAATDGLLDGLVAGGTYHLNLLLRRESNEIKVNFDYGSLTVSYLALNNISWESDPDTANVDLNVEVFPNDTNIAVVNRFSIPPGAEHYLYIGKPEDASTLVFGQGGHIDDVRIGRIDVQPHVELSLGPAVLDGSLDLMPGRYRFSVWVKAEIDAAVTPATRNAFRADQMSIGINNTRVVFDAEELGLTDSEWKQVFVDEVLTWSDISDPDAIVLTMTVTNIDRPVLGRILIAAPTLEFVVN